MGKTVRVTRKETIANSQINWHMTEDNCYGVELLIKTDGVPQRSLRKWTFGRGPTDEAISFYWYKQMLKMVKHYYEDPEETDITRIITKTESKDINHMCKEAVKTCFAI